MLWFLTQTTSSVLCALNVSGLCSAALIALIPPLIFFPGTHLRLSDWCCLRCCCCSVMAQWELYSWSTGGPLWYRRQGEPWVLWLCSAWWEPASVCCSSWESRGIWCVVFSCPSSPFSKQSHCPLWRPSHYRWVMTGKIHYCTVGQTKGSIL